MALALLAPPEQAAAFMPGETLEFGGAPENRQYQRVLAVASSQERRIIQHKAIRRHPGYDLSDPWLVSGSDDIDTLAVSSGKRRSVELDRLVSGVPCQLVGSGELCAYLGPVDGQTGSKEDHGCRVRFMSGNTSICTRGKLLPLPTRPPQQGDWALPVALAPQQAHLLGRRGLCGIEAPVAGQGQGMWMMFEQPDPTVPPEMVLVAKANLVSLATPSPGASRTPWDARQALCDKPQRKFGGEQLMAIADEAANEQQLALQYGDDEEDEDIVSVDISSDDDDDEGEEADAMLDVGCLVRVAVAGGGRTRHGRVEGTTGPVGGKLPPRVMVRLFEGSGSGSCVEEFTIPELTLVSEADLELAATCSRCGAAEPEDQLILCDMFCKRCLNGAHLSCLDPPLVAVPEGQWLCEPCNVSGRSSAVAVAAQRSEDSDGGPSPVKKARVESKSKAKAKGKAKAETKAGSTSRSGSKRCDSK